MNKKDIWQKKKKKKKKKKNERKKKNNMQNKWLNVIKNKR